MSSLDKQEMWDMAKSLGGKRIDYKSFGGSVFTGYVIKDFKLFKRIATVHGSRWAYPEPYRYEVKIKLIPFWRIYDQTP